MGRPTARRARWLGVLAALGLVACVPVKPPPPPPPPPASAPGCGSNAEPTPTEPVEYVAVVDEPGAGAPEVETFTATSEAEKEAVVDDLARNGAVLAVEPDEPVTALVTEDDPRLGEQWGLVNSGFSAAWSSGVDGTGVTIAVLDTGVHAAHEDLTDKVVAGIDFYAGSEAQPAGNSNFGRVDAHGHGTHVAGIAAASDNALGGLGGAPGATLLPVRVLGPNGSGYTSDVVDGILWAADPAKGNADVISLSLGGSYCSASEQAAVDYAESQGVVVIAAAGNSSSNVPIYPAGFDGEVIAVGATTNVNAKASFSNWGTPFVDIAAPGVSILSTYKDSSGSPPNAAYRLLSGTSMSTPFVAAAVALVLQHCSSIPNGPAAGASRGDKVMALLQSTAGPDIPGLGAKLLQAGSAATAACPS